jgi:hypothetical protein
LSDVSTSVSNNFSTLNQYINDINNISIPDIYNYITSGVETNLSSLESTVSGLGTLLGSVNSSLTTLQADFTSSQIKYMFSVTSNLNATISVTNGSVLPFNYIESPICFVVPSTTAFNLTTYSYTIPKSGIWRINIQLFFNSGASTQSRIALYANNILLHRFGAQTGYTESGGILYNLNVNDVINIRNDDVTTLSMYFGLRRSLFYGEYVG